MSNLSLKNASHTRSIQGTATGTVADVMIASGKNGSRPSSELLIRNTGGADLLVSVNNGITFEKVPSAATLYWRSPVYELQIKSGSSVTYEIWVGYDRPHTPM